MNSYIVTVKLAKNFDHDPRNKVTGPCVLSPSCTDVTGEHHSIIVRAETDAAALGLARATWSHVTRVERVYVVEG